MDSVATTKSLLPDEINDLYQHIGMKPHIKRPSMGMPRIADTSYNLRAMATIEELKHRNKEKEDRARTIEVKNAVYQSMND